MKKTILALLLLASLTTQAQTHRIHYVPDSIEIDLPDIVIDNTIIKRKAFASEMDYNLQRQTVTMKWLIKAYSNDNGNYGDLINKVIPSYTKVTVASNDIAVNPANGAVLIKDSTGHYEMDWIGQYDFFAKMASDIPIKVNSVIKQYGMRVTDWDKK